MKKHKKGKAYSGTKKRPFEKEEEPDTLDDKYRDTDERDPFENETWD